MLCIGYYYDNVTSIGYSASSFNLARSNGKAGGALALAAPAHPKATLAQC